MDRDAQLDAIVDKLVGVPPETLPPLSAFDEPWRTIFRRVTRAVEHTDACYLIYRASEHLENRRYVTRDLYDRLPFDDVFTAYPSLHEIASRFHDVDWLWPSWIPRGVLTLFGAAPGAGKSLVALDLARRIIAGEPFPDGTPVPCPGSYVLIVDAEGAPGLLNQRAEAWALDRRRLFLMLAPEPAGLIDLAHPAQQDLLREMVRCLEPGLVVVDSLAAATATGETSLQGARATLGFLASVARDHSVPLLLIHHLRKKSRLTTSTAAPRVAADDLRGSSHISASARSVLALSVPGRAPSFSFHPAATDPPPAIEGPRRLEVVKTNLCRRPPPLGVLFEGENVPVPTLRYVPLVEPPPPPAQVDLCARWLLDYLAAAGEPTRPAHVLQAAEEAGFRQRTVYRAREALAGWVVDIGRGPRDPGKRWALSDGALIAPTVSTP